MYRKPTKFDFDLIVIGSGSGGNVAAHRIATAGKKVAMVEMEKIGGECPNFGCVPTKALLQAAEVYKVAREGVQFGVYTEARFKYPEVKAWKELAVRRTGTSEGAAFYEQEGITLFKGHAHFLDPWTITLGHRRATARHFLVASGTSSVIPPIPGLEEVDFMTYRQAIDLDKPPRSLFVVGGGAIGCEFAELFSTFGTKVHIADFAPRLIPLEDADAGELLKGVFERKGIQVHLETRVNRITKDGTKKVVHFQQGDNHHQVTVDDLFIATGKAPNTDMGLENAGVAYGKHGITVNPFMQTSSKHIFAAGDVVGPYAFTHMASYQSRIAAHNLLHPHQKVKADYRAVPRCIFVDPEIACAGQTEQQLKDRNTPYVVGAAPISIIGRSNTTNSDIGFVKVMANRRGKLLGASIVSPRAGEMIHELTLAIQVGLNARQVAETIHAFPTWSEAVRLSCQKVVAQTDKP